MSEPRLRARGWGRLTALLLLVLALWVGQPLVAVAIPFGLLAILLPVEKLRVPILGAVLLGLSLGGMAAADGFWYLERGWLLLTGGWFVAVSLAWPARPFLPRALTALAGSAVWTGGLLLALGGLGQADRLVRERVLGAAGATRELLGGLTGGPLDPSLAEALERTMEVQLFLVPATILLATLAALAAGWWMCIRIRTGSGDALGRLRNFRFADGLIWLLIAGLVVGLVADWTGGWGRTGLNMAVFMGALYALRGFGVLLFLTGGLSWFGWGLLILGLLLAAPLLLAAALVVGVADSWLDLRMRAASSGGSGPDST
ncbi:MAG: DUF2232 domain-containing protein [Gemmatimonadales bacterium]|nr:MAG: DUF2232 domain-containing protein [Gemmatimonadales bacterium]